MRWSRQTTRSNEGTYKEQIQTQNNVAPTVMKNPMMFQIAMSCVMLLNIFQ